MRLFDFDPSTIVYPGKGSLKMIFKERNRGRFSAMTEKQRMTYNEPGDEYGENSKSSGKQRDLPCDAAGITGKGYTKTTRNAYGEPSPVHLGIGCLSRDPGPGDQVQGLFVEY